MGKGSSMPSEQILCSTAANSALPRRPFYQDNASVEPALPHCHNEDMAATPQDIPKSDDAKSSEKLSGPKPSQAQPREIGGPKGPEPTRYGDWEVNGRCTDF